MFPASSKLVNQGMVFAFPDVCKTPAPPAPFVPIPYPNIGMSKGVSKFGAKKSPVKQATKRQATKTPSRAIVSQKRSQMTALHHQMQGLPSTASAQAWHRLLEQYVLAASATFNELNPD